MTTTAEGPKAATLSELKAAPWGSQRLDSDAARSGRDQSQPPKRHTSRATRRGSPGEGRSREGQGGRSGASRSPIDWRRSDHGRQCQRWRRSSERRPAGPVRRGDRRRCDAGRHEPHGSPTKRSSEPTLATRPRLPAGDERPGQARRDSREVQDPREVTRATVEPHETKQHFFILEIEI